MYSRSARCNFSALKNPTLYGSDTKAATTTTHRALTVATVSAGSHLKPPYWQKIRRWRSVSEEDFCSYKWQTLNTIQKSKVLTFLEENVPDFIPPPNGSSTWFTKAQFLEDIEAGNKRAPMALRVTPHTASLVDWRAPYQDPIFRQFYPAASTFVPDHKELRLDSLNEQADSPIKGLVHRYPHKVLFTVTSSCPTYCRFCTRSYAVGSAVDSFQKDTIRLNRSKRDEILSEIKKNPEIHDVVISGGDAYMIDTAQLQSIGETLLEIPHIRRFRIASKGLAVCPSRIIDPADDWASTLINLSKKGREMGKEVALHTHFNHACEITWITELATQRLFREGVVVRNQTVLLRGVNDDIEAMHTLIRELADNNVEPLYVYMCDMVQGVEDLRVPLHTALHIDEYMRGTIGGAKTPRFVVDLPGGGGKVPITAYRSYDQETGISTWQAPAIKGDQLFEYHDPAPTFEQTNDIGRFR